MFHDKHICWSPEGMYRHTGGGGSSIRWRDFWALCSEAFSAPLAHLSFFRPRGADTIARGTQTHTRLNTFSWLCLAMLPACGLLDLPLCCHYLIAALVQHGAMFMWPGFRPPNVPPNSNWWSHPLKKPQKLFNRIMCAIWLALLSKAC